MGITAPAQTNNQGGASDSQKGDSQQNQQQKGDAKQQNDAKQAQGQTERVRGELAAVSVVGETMVDYSTGRGVVAEFTYLTILGSPADGGRQGGSGRRANFDREADNRKNQSSKNDNSGSEKKDQGQGSNQGQANKDQGNQGRSGGGAMNRRRSVYEIAVGPETRVRTRSSQGGGNSGDRKDDQQGSARDQSKAHLERLQLGDRVEVEFTRMSPPSRSGAGGDQGGSANQSRHGRNRLIRGVAKTVTILSAPDQQGGDDKNAESRKDGDSSSAKDESGSGSQEKKADRKD